MTAPGRSSNTIVLALSGAIGREDVLVLCARVRLLLEGCGADRIVCDVGALVEPDVATIDVLARLQATASRLGCRIRLRGASVDLQELISVVGLGEVLPLSAGSWFEVIGQTEVLEQVGVEEEAELDDPSA